MIKKKKVLTHSRTWTIMECYKVNVILLIRLYSIINISVLGGHLIAQQEDNNVDFSTHSRF